MCCQRTSPYITSCDHSHRMRCKIGLTHDFFSFSGNTYDRCIVVDDEESAIVLYDMWEQVRFMKIFPRTQIHIHHQHVKLKSATLCSIMKDNSQWLKEQCMRMGDAYIIVYSVTDKSSFEKASELRIQLRRARQSEDIPIILVGNKSDLVRSREVSVDGKSLTLTREPN